MMHPKLVLLGCLGSTLFLTGLIWFVQLVHYPLFGAVPAEAFGRYHAEHVRRVGRLVLAPMVLELATSVVLAIRPPERVGRGLAWAGLGAVVLVWASTLVLQVPRHNRLASGFDPDVHRSLVRTNGARAALWTVHAGIVLAMTARALG